MTIKIAILGSTGSIGTNTINIIKKNRKDFKVIFLSTNNNASKIFKQAKELDVKKIIINNKLKYLKIKKKFEKNKIKVYLKNSDLNKIIKKKIDYTMCAISGLDGLKPTLDAIKFSKKIGIANKESLICAWNLIHKKLKKYKTDFIPIDSEHFSIWSLLNNSKNNVVDEVIITASGGPFLNLPLNKFKKIKPKTAIKHPNWNMGKKISIDSATMMNKVFEVIEAQRIFNIDINKFRILIHPKSYIHAIIKFNNGLTKILVHDTDMKIPIFNSIYGQNVKKINSNKLNLSILNNLNFIKANLQRYPSISLIKMISNNISLFETVLVSANDELVNLFLNKKIKFNDIIIKLRKIIDNKEFQKYKGITPKNFKEISKLSNYVRLKTRSLCI